MTIVFLPTHLRSYTAGAAEVHADGATLGEVLADLESRYPGMRVRIIDEQERIRPHVECFISGVQVHDLDAAVLGDVQIAAILPAG